MSPKHKGELGIVNSTVIIPSKLFSERITESGIMCLIICSTGDIGVFPKKLL